MSRQAVVMLAIAAGIASAVPSVSARSATAKGQPSCAWHSISRAWKVQGNRAVICTLSSRRASLSATQANALLPTIGRLYASAEYGPRRHFTVAVPDHCVVQVGRIADCEIEFTKPSVVFPPCGQLFQMTLGNLRAASIDTRHPSSEVVVWPELSGLCHDPSTVNAMLGP